jgi:hypothetical protein
MPMLQLAVRTSLVLLLPLLGACAAVPSEPDPAPPASLKRFAACDAELRAFIAVARMVRQQGENSTLYEPALQAMKDQILDCVEESYSGAQPI